MNKKTNIGKRFLSLFLTFVIVMTMIPQLSLSAFADNTSFSGNEYYGSTDSSAVPEDYEPIDSMNLLRTSTLRASAAEDDSTEERIQVLLIEDTLPWRSNTNSNLLNMLGISFKKVKTSEFLSEDLGNYSVIVFANDQQFSTYQNYSGFKEQIELYAELGGVVLFGACDADGHRELLFHHFREMLQNLVITRRTIILLMPSIQL